MSQFASILFIICVSVIGIIVSIWFNCNIHQEIRRRIGLSSRIIPVVEARQISQELPVNIVVIEVNNDV